MIYQATLKTINGNISLGKSGKKTKRAMLDMMIKNGKDICDHLDDYGDFDFVWNTKTKVWEFFSEKGDKIGFCKFEYDSKSTMDKKWKLYYEQKSAYDAQLKMKK